MSAADDKMASFAVARGLVLAACLSVLAAAVSSIFYSWRVVVAWLLLALLVAVVARAELRLVRRYRADRRRAARGDARLLAAIRRMDTVRVFDPPSLEELERDWSVS
jgi:hypothetical protein